MSRTEIGVDSAGVPGAYSMYVPAPPAGAFGQKDKRGRSQHGAPAVVRAGVAEDMERWEVPHEGSLVGEMSHTTVALVERYR